MKITLPEPYCYVKIDGDDYEYNTIDEFSGGRRNGVKLYTEEQVRELLAGQPEKISHTMAEAVSLAYQRGASAGKPEAKPFGYFHQTLDHDGKPNGIWLGCDDLDVVEKSYIKGEVSKEIVTLYVAPPAAQPLTLTQVDADEEFTDRYEGTILRLPNLLVSMALTMISDPGSDDDHVYLTFDAGQHESGDPVEYPISRAAADDILAACLEKP